MTITILGAALSYGFGPGVDAAIGRPALAPAGVLSPVPATPDRRATSEAVRVVIPDVVLPEHLQVVGGRLRVPMVLAAPHLTAVASVRGDPACTARLAPSVVAWIDCVRGPGPVTLVVRLSDGRKVVRSSVED